MIRQLRSALVLVTLAMYSCGAPSGADGGSGGGSTGGGSTGGGSTGGGSTGGGSAGGGSAGGGSAGGGSAGGGPAGGGSAGGGSAGGGSAGGGSAGGGSASCGAGVGHSVDFIEATVFGQPLAIEKTGSNIFSAGPSIVPGVVGLSGMQLSPLASLALTTTFFDGGTRCNLNVMATPPGGSLLTFTSLGPDGGSDCVNNYTQVANDAGEKYVGTFSGNLWLLTGSDGGAYPISCGAFSMTR